MKTTRSHSCRAFLFLAVFSIASFASSSDSVGWRDPSASPSDPLWTGTSFNDSIKSTGAHLLHAIGITGRGVTAAVMDTPYDVYHERIRNNIIDEACASISNIEVGDRNTLPFRPGMELVDSDEDEDTYLGVGKDMAAIRPGDVVGYPYSAGNYTHGTHVAGTIVAMAPKAGLALIAPVAWTRYTNPMLPDELRVFGETFEGFALVADMADKYNIVAMNNSWGGGQYISEQAAQNDPDAQAYNMALQPLLEAGVVPVFASGNGGVNNYLTTPGVAPDANANVGALHPAGTVTLFSDISDKVVLVAPGQNIYSSVPFGGKLQSSAGTSMAAPHVTGAIALLASGARNASTSQIYQSILATGDVVRYDGDIVMTPAEAGMADVIYQTIADKLSIPFDFTTSHTFTEWRQGTRFQNAIGSLYNIFLDEWKKKPINAAYDADALRNSFLSELDTNQAYWLGKLREVLSLAPSAMEPDNVEYRFLRVDKAYKYLTASRMNIRAGEIADSSSIGSGMLRSFADEMAADLNEETANIFQRIDASEGSRLARTARKLSPQLSLQTVEYSQLGVLNILRSIGRSGDAARDRARLWPTAEDECGDPAEAARIAFEGHSQPRFWVEGFGSFAHRSDTTQAAGFNSHFAGGSLGLERRLCGLTYGVFGSWADLEVDSNDGKSDGRWYTAGLYGRLDRQKYFVQGSAAYSYGEFKPNRDIFIPGAIFTDNTPDNFIVLDPMQFRTGAKTKSHSANAFLSFGYDAWEGKGWSLGPRVEGAYSFAHMKGYRERGGGSLNLGVDGMNNHYAEGGVGLAATKSFLDDCGRSRVTVSGKVMGFYGASFGERMRGRFTQYGSAFEASPERTKGFWCVPEASVNWKVNKHVDVTATYAGRFGSRYSENAGFLKFGISW